MIKCGLCDQEVLKGSVVRLRWSEITDRKGRLLSKFNKFANHNKGKGMVKVCKQCRSKLND